MQEEWLAEGIAPLSKETAQQDVDIGSHGLARWEVLERGDVIHGPLASMPASERAYFGASACAPLPRCRCSPRTLVGLPRLHR